MLIDRIDSLIGDPILRRHVREFFDGAFMKDAKRRDVGDLELRLRTQFPDLEQPRDVAVALLGRQVKLSRSAGR